MDFRKSRCSHLILKTETISLKSFSIFSPPRKEGDKLIKVLDESDHAVPKELESEPRMLLYICTLWREDKMIKERGATKTPKRTYYGLHPKNKRLNHSMAAKSSLIWFGF